MTKNILFITSFLLVSCICFAQNQIEWSADYLLKAEDFQGNVPGPLQAESIYASFYVQYEMKGVSVVTTRNLNKNVVALFQKDESFIGSNVTANERQLLYQQLIFNIYELQARNLRKKFFTQRTRLLTKGPADLHQEALAEHKELLSEVESDTYNGQSSEEIDKWMEWTLQELEKLNDFCKEGKPNKKDYKKR